MEPHRGGVREPLRQRAEAGEGGGRLGFVEAGDGRCDPGLGIAGPTGSFAGFSDVSTVTMTILMWLGRLEVIPVLVLATRRYWRV